MNRFDLHIRFIWREKKKPKHISKTIVVADRWSARSLTKIWVTIVLASSKSQTRMADRPESEREREREREREETRE